MEINFIEYSIEGDCGETEGKKHIKYRQWLSMERNNKWMSETRQCLRKEI